MEEEVYNKKEDEKANETNHEHADQMWKQLMSLWGNSLKCALLSRLLNSNAMKQAQTCMCT